MDLFNFVLVQLITLPEGGRLRGRDHDGGVDGDEDGEPPEDDQGHGNGVVEEICVWLPLILRYAWNLDTKLHSTYSPRLDQILW